MHRDYDRRENVKYIYETKPLHIHHAAGVGRIAFFNPAIIRINTILL